MQHSVRCFDGCAVAGFRAGLDGLLVAGIQHKLWRGCWLKLELDSVDPRLQLKHFIGLAGSLGGICSSIHPGRISLHSHLRLSTHFSAFPLRPSVGTIFKKQVLLFVTVSSCCSGALLGVLMKPLALRWPYAVHFGIPGALSLGTRGCPWLNICKRRLGSVGCKSER
jgi:hypothetical protein